MDEKFSTKFHCWREIFGFLDYRSRVRCQASCKILCTFVDTFNKHQKRFNFADVRPSASDELQVTWSTAAVSVCSQIGESLLLLTTSVDLSVTAETLNKIILHCPNIERIDLHAPSTAATIHFEKLAKLRELNLIGREPPTRNFDVLKLHPFPPTVEKLTGLRGVQAEDMDALRHFFVEHPNLRHFEMSDSNASRELNAAMFLFHLIADNCPRIERLAVIDCTNVNLDGIERLAGLLTLNVSTTGYVHFQLTDEQVIQICSRNPRLEILRIVGNDCRLGPKACAAIASLCRCVELEISCYRWSHSLIKFDDDCFRTIIKGVGPSLRRLSLRWPEHLTDASVDAIAEWCPNLRLLVIRQAEVAVLSSAALRRLIDAISPNFDPMSERFEIYLSWRFLAPLHHSLLTSASLPAGVTVRRFDDNANKCLPSTIAPVVLLN